MGFKTFNNPCCARSVCVGVIYATTIHLVLVEFVPSAGQKLSIIREEQQDGSVDSHRFQAPRRIRCCRSEYPIGPSTDRRGTYRTLFFFLSSSFHIFYSILSVVLLTVYLYII